MSGLSPLLVNRQKRFFACEMFAKGRVNIQIALKCSNLSIFSLTFPRFSKTVFDVLNPTPPPPLRPPNSEIMWLKPSSNVT